MGVGRGGAGGGFGPRFGFWGTAPVPPLEPPAVLPDPVDVPDPPTRVEEVRVGRGVGVDLEGVGDAETAALGEGDAEGLALRASAVGDAETVGAGSASPGSAEHPPTHSTVRTVAGPKAAATPSGRAGRTGPPTVTKVE